MTSASVAAANIRLSEAAVKAGLAPSALLAELEALAESARRDAPEETLDLIKHILDRYHQTHRAELAWLIPLAQKVERVHGDHPAAPVGLSQALDRLRDELESHMMKEEQVLFPMMRRGGSPVIGHPIAQMGHEHEEEAEHLRAIEHVTHGLSLPPCACGSWTALYTGLRKFTDDLVMHMHLENAVLFPRFETQSQAAV
nr:hemerythrin domain-containing protein [Sinorhizobium alkalisoli]